MSICNIINCPSNVYALGLCRKHYQTHRRRKAGAKDRFTLRSLIIHETYADIQLANGLLAKIDLIDINTVCEYNWCIANGYAYNKDLGYLHNLITNNADHINHDKLDNRRNNLRKATNSQNQANTRLSKNNTSGYKGVSWVEGKQRWIARLADRQVGQSTNKHKAAEMYNKAALAKYGEFALLNIIS